MVLDSKSLRFSYPLTNCVALDEPRPPLENYTWYCRPMSVSVHLRLAAGDCGPEDCEDLLACGCVLSPSSHVRLFATLWTVAHQPPLSMGFSRQEYWSGLPFPFPGDFPDSRIEPTFPSWQVESLPLSHMGSHRSSTKA